MAATDDSQLLRAGSLGASLPDANGEGDNAALVPTRALSRRLGRRYLRPAIEVVVQAPRIRKYKLLSTCRQITGSPVILQPVLIVGPGRPVLGEGVQFGWKASPLFYTGYCHVEVSDRASRIEIGDRTEFNNNGSQKVAPVEIGDNVFVGMGARILQGTTIGSDSVIGAGAVVTGSIPAGVVAAGNPARVIRDL